MRGFFNEITVARGTNFGWGYHVLDYLVKKESSKVVLNTSQLGPALIKAENSGLMQLDPIPSYRKCAYS